jgi:serine/threonine protein kinase
MRPVRALQRDTSRRLSFEPVRYEAEDTRLGRRVAVKMLPPEMATEAKAVTRFLREGKAAATLNHPSICGVLDVGEDGGQPFIVMERPTRGLARLQTSRSAWEGVRRSAGPSSPG